MVDPLKMLFPKLASGYTTSSPRNQAYNCIAWAAEDTRTWWWPEPGAEGAFWPADVSREATLASFRGLFASLGYVECDVAALDPGVTKIALFADAAGLLLHAARQSRNGRWTSKLGELEDIEHGLHDLEGEEYGNVVLLMKRPWKPVLGLIGGIGSGKSLVATEFAHHGGAIVSGDHLGHKALQRQEVLDQVVKRWGESVLGTEGEIDRRKLGALVFADIGELRAL
jgi:hypothetical protein